MIIKSSKLLFLFTRNVFVVGKRYVTTQTRGDPLFPHPKKNDFKSGMKPVLVVIFSVFSIIFGFGSVGLQLAALILYTRISNYVVLGYDVVAHGIWCGFIYIGAGSQGLYSSYNQPKALFMTVVTAGVAVCGAIVAATLSGLVASSGFSYACDSYHYSSSCLPWLDLEWALMGISILAGINNLILMYYANVARHSDKCRGRNHHIRSDSHSESPGPYVIHDRRHQQPQNVVTSDI